MMRSVSSNWFRSKISTLNSLGESLWACGLGVFWEEMKAGWKLNGQLKGVAVIHFNSYAAEFEG